MEDVPKEGLYMDHLCKDLIINSTSEENTSLSKDRFECWENYAPFPSKFDLAPKNKVVSEPKINGGFREDVIGWCTAATSGEVELQELEHSDASLARSARCMGRGFGRLHRIGANRRHYSKWHQDAERSTDEGQDRGVLTSLLFQAVGFDESNLYKIANRT